MQNKTKSLLESITNTLSGLVVNFLLSLLIYPILNIPVKLHQNLIIVIIFTGTSILRNFIVRRYFNA
jgi:hypothetical protein